jgi:diguanylate cyclase (GGDEF)-like protein
MRIDPFVASAAAAGTVAAVLVAALVAVLLHARGLRRALARSVDRHRYLLRHDPVTGVATRAALRDRLDALDGSDGYAVVVVDLDAFAAVNDSHGEVVGDAVLAEVARRIARLARPCDVVGRLDGDAFAVVRSGRPADADLACWVEAIVAAVRAPVVLTDGTTLTVAATAGRARATAGMRPLAVVRAAEQNLIAGRRSRDALDRALAARMPAIPGQAGAPAAELLVVGRRR